MLGKSHALSGAVGWLALSAGAVTLGRPLSGWTVTAGAVVSTACAILPDIDHEGSTVARTLGPVTRVVASVVSVLSARLRLVSCGHCLSRPSRGGHRGVTHTAAGALAAGVLVALGGWLGGERFGLAVLFVAVWLAAHVGLSSAARAKVGDMLLPGRFRRLGRGAHRFAAAVGALVLAGAVMSVAGHEVQGGWWWLGVPVFWGCLAHSLGDALTMSRVPLLWPLLIGGCRWAPVGSPRWLRFRTGSAAEKVVVLLLAVSGLGALAVLGGAV